MMPRAVLVVEDELAARIGPDMRMAVVGAPSYFAKHPMPRVPQDLTSHACINPRLPTYGGFYACEFEKGKRELGVREEGPLAFNLARLAVEAALGGDGLAFVLEQQVDDHIAERQLLRALAVLCPPFAGYPLYCTSRRQLLAAPSLASKYAALLRT